jgi:hypothetical protein
LEFLEYAEAGRALKRIFRGIWEKIHDWQCPNFGRSDPARNSSILGMVSCIRYLPFAVGDICGRTFRNSYNRLDAVLRLAARTSLACGVEVAQAVLVGHWAGFFHHLVAAILFGVTGFLLATRPLLGAEVATILIAAFFLISGLFQFIGSLGLRCRAGVGRHWTE